MDTTLLLISLHRKHSNNVFNGVKTIELRKIKPRTPGKVLVYETLPTASIVGYFECSGITYRTTEEWLSFTTELCISIDHVKSYLTSGYGYGIHVRNPQKLSNPVPLSKMKEVSIPPPQCYRYLSKEDLEKLRIVL